MKKKILSLCMAVSLVLGSGTVVMAETLEAKDTSTSHEVKGKYHMMAEPATVYKVDVQWGSMEFTYQGAGTTRRWNVKTHEYSDEITDEGKWIYEDGANKILITNSSNKAITATIATAMEGSGITADITNPTINLEDASIGATTEQAGTASKGEATISLAGELSDKNASKAKIGTVTISFADTATTEQP